MMLSGSSLGSIVGVFVSGWLADVVGRRVAVTLCAATTCLFSIVFFVLPLGKHYWALVAVHTALGIPFGGLSTIITPYCLEFFPDDSRGKAAMATSLGWPAGSIWCIQLVDYLTVDAWRACFALGGLVPGVALLLLIYFMPESPRWLYTVGRRAQGEAVLTHIFDSEPLLGGRARGPPPTISKMQQEHKESPLKLLGDLFSPSMRLLTCISCMLYVFTASASFSGWMWAPDILTTISGRAIANVFFMMTEVSGVVGAFVGVMVLDRWGRRATLLFSYVLGLSVYAVLGSGWFPATVGWIWLLVGLVQGLMWPALGTYLTEAIPTKLRGTGNGVAAVFGRLAMITAPWAVGKFISVSVYAGLVMLMAFYGFAALFALIIPYETRE